MSVPLLIEQIDLERCIGAERFAQLEGRLGTGRAGAADVQDLLQTASDEGARLLAPGFTGDELVALVRRDAAIRKKIAWVGIGMATPGRSEYQDTNGKFLFEAVCAEAKKELAAIGRKAAESIGAVQNGTRNRLGGVRVGQRRDRPRCFNFADTKDRRGSGGF